jgi:hypothetical protein
MFAAVILKLYWTFAFSEVTWYWKSANESIVVLVQVVSMPVFW